MSFPSLKKYYYGNLKKCQHTINANDLNVNNLNEN